MEFEDVCDVVSVVVEAFWFVDVVDVDAEAFALVELFAADVVPSLL